MSQEQAEADALAEKLGLIMEPVTAPVERMLKEAFRLGMGHGAKVQRTMCADRGCMWCGAGSP